MVRTSVIIIILSKFRVFKLGFFHFKILLNSLLIFLKIVTNKLHFIFQFLLYGKAFYDKKLINFKSITWRRKLFILKIVRIKTSKKIKKWKFLL